MNAEELGWQLRRGTGTFLVRRRAIVGLEMIAIGSMSLITLYQLGIISLRYPD